MIWFISFELDTFNYAYAFLPYQYYLWYQSEYISKLQTAFSHFKLTPNPTKVETFTRGNQDTTYAVYNIPDFVGKRRVLNIHATYDHHLLRKQMEPPVLHAHRFSTGKLMNILNGEDPGFLF